MEIGSFNVIPKVYNIMIYNYDEKKTPIGGALMIQVQVTVNNAYKYMELKITFFRKSDIYVYIYILIYYK